MNHLKINIKTDIKPCTLSDLIKFIMKLIKFLILLAFTKFIFCKKDYNNNLHKFLLDYFEDRNVTVRLILCWNFDEIKHLTYKFFNSKFPIQVYIHTDFNNVDFLELMHFNIYNIIDVNCEGTKYILSKANEKMLFRAPQKWLLIQITNSSTSTSLYYDTYTNLLNPFDIQVDSEVACVDYNENNILVWFYFKENENRTITKELYGTWNATNGFQNKLTNNITSFRRKNLQGANIRIVCVMSDPDTINHLDDYKYPMRDVITKSQYGNVMSLIDYLNSTYTIVRADQWGVIEDHSTKRWGGLSGFIQRKEADISGSAMFFFKARIDIGRFLKLSNPSVIQFFFRKPPLSVEQNIYALPFSYGVWISSVLLFLLISMVFILFSYFENSRNQEIEKVGFGNILLLMGAAVCQQGCDIVPTGVPGRILTLLVFTAFMFLYVSYSANIVALLQSSSDSIKTMEDLLLSKNMKVGLHNISYNFQYFGNSTEPIPMQLYNEKIGPKGIYEVDEGVRRIKEGLFAFHVEEGAAYYYILKTFEEHEKCDTTTMKGVFQEQMGWMQARLESPHLEMFKIGFYKTGEYGIERRFFQRFYRKLSCYSQAGGFTSVGIREFYPAIVVFVYGLLSAVLLFLFEHLHKKYATMRGNKARKFDFLDRGFQY